MERGARQAYAPRSELVGWLSITSSKTLTAALCWAPRGKGDFMNRMPSPGDECNEAPELNPVDIARYTIDGSNGASTLPQDPADEPKAVLERLDIDTAMVEALRNALAPGHGSLGPGWDGSEPYQRGEARRPTDLSVLTQGPPELARRCDIDLAVLDALHHAKGHDPEVPGA